MKYDDIKCPKCGVVQPIDDGCEWVTYWGEDPHDILCNECDHVYAVDELVQRSYSYRGRSQP